MGFNNTYDAVPLAGRMVMRAPSPSAFRLAHEI
jgi:hypothetical protein